MGNTAAINDLPNGVDILGPVQPGFEEILTPEALNFVAGLARTYTRRVSELLDDHLIGDGVLSTITDARKRLLTPSAAVIPSGAKVFATPVEMRASRCLAWYCPAS